MTSKGDKAWFKESLKHDKAWRSTLKAERGITAENIEAKIFEAWDHPRVPDEDVHDAKRAFQRSYLLFVQSVESGDASLRELSMMEGALAFARSDKLHTKLVLAKEVARDRARQKGPRKKNDELQAAVNKLVTRFPDFSATELWGKASSLITDQVGVDRFRKRVTESRRLGRK